MRLINSEFDRLAQNHTKEELEKEKSKVEELNKAKSVLEKSNSKLTSELKARTEKSEKVSSTMFVCISGRRETFQFKLHLRKTLILQLLKLLWASTTV